LKKIIDIGIKNVLFQNRIRPDQKKKMSRNGKQEAKEREGVPVKVWIARGGKDRGTFENVSKPGPDKSYK